MIDVIFYYKGYFQTLITLVLGLLNLKYLKGGWKESVSIWNEWQKRFKKPIKAEVREEVNLPNAVLLNPGVLHELFSESNVLSVTLQPIIDTEVNLLIVSDDPEGSQNYFNLSRPCPPYCDTFSDLM